MRQHDRWATAYQLQSYRQEQRCEAAVVFECCCECPSTTVADGSALFHLCQSPSRSSLHVKPQTHTEVDHFEIVALQCPRESASTGLPNVIGLHRRVSTATLELLRHEQRWLRRVPGFQRWSFGTVPPLEHRHLHLQFHCSAVITSVHYVPLYHGVAHTPRERLVMLQFTARASAKARVPPLRRQLICSDVRVSLLYS